ncbi:hypothetical protein AMTR_s00065p00109250 [Amborella trichopoda]|uniref:Ubiquitin fusion degradation protein UFD1 N-terminal subdomain 1 domain-containing protein n=1 Tax=Amborella trichopoda TaxID=13333 RepID=U5D7Y3_AMBTC|nr:hypothetical protein AMTR_s00065p00109250 [Amborella trichopoda]
MPELENGDNVIMPPSALDHLASIHTDNPMVFELYNPATQCKTHCGVLEFVAEEGTLYMPYWMMQNMLLQEGDTVQIKSTALSKGTYVKFRPDTMDLFHLSNPKAVPGNVLEPQHVSHRAQPGPSISWTGLARTRQFIAQPILEGSGLAQAKGNALACRDKDVPGPFFGLTWTLK